MRERDDTWILVLLAMGVGVLALYGWYTKKPETEVEEGVIRFN